VKETHEILENVHGSETVPCVQVFEWFIRCMDIC